VPLPGTQDDVFTDKMFFDILVQNQRREYRLGTHVAIPADYDYLGKVVWHVCLDVPLPVEAGLLCGSLDERRDAAQFATHLSPDAVDALLLHKLNRFNIFYVPDDVFVVARFHFPHRPFHQLQRSGLILIKTLEMGDHQLLVAFGAEIQADTLLPLPRYSRLLAWPRAARPPKN
jgi:hypothetical protein